MLPILPTKDEPERRDVGLRQLLPERLIEVLIVAKMLRRLVKSRESYLRESHRLHNLIDHAPASELSENPLQSRLSLC